MAAEMPPVFMYGFKCMKKAKINNFVIDLTKMQRYTLYREIVN